MKSRNIRLLVEYDGSTYAGWQTQGELPTIQGTLTAALQQITHEPDIALMVAGRTDAGVHAYGQVANFRTDHPREARRFAPALNHFLPDSIRIHRAEAADCTFDARHDARSKRYRYRVYEGPHTPALERQQVWHVRRHLQLEVMRQAAAPLLGEHDFESFRSVHCDAAHAVRHMLSIDIVATPRPPLGRTVDITFHANAFCRHMCRILAGTLVEVGASVRPPDAVARALQARSRPHAGITAPPGGLTLLEVLY